MIRDNVSPPLRPEPDTPIHFRIYGDNILECEKAVSYAGQALGRSPTRVPGPLHMPEYRIEGTPISFQLLPGYGRWQVDLAALLRRRGGVLREYPDAIICREDPGEPFGLSPRLALEFCGALPAGNQAWQRCGRALSLATAAIPYLYLAEIGGAELGEARAEKAARVPNPLVPFAYLALSDWTRAPSFPAFLPSPSLRREDEMRFADGLAGEEVYDFIRHALMGDDPILLPEVAREKARFIVGQLAMSRRASGFSADDWDRCSDAGVGHARADYFVQRRLPWSKKMTIETTPTVEELKRLAIHHGAVGPGTSDFALCVIPMSERRAFASAVQNLYGSALTGSLVEWLRAEGGHLVLVWLAGFKPKGEDSRPDRGLIPLARMVFGKDVDLLGIVYGPVKPQVAAAFPGNLPHLAQQNGLWETIVALSDAVLLDSRNATDLATKGVLLEPGVDVPQGPALEAQESSPILGEHDVDTVLHTILGNATDLHIHEGMCNPPGGDWSGITFANPVDGEHLRWTSLPRVTPSGSKRPDHVVLLHQPHLLALCIESKDRPKDVPQGIGPKLTRYIENLFAQAPNIRRSATGWQPATSAWRTPTISYLSGVAFVHSNEATLLRALMRSQADLAIGVAFAASGRVTLHVAAHPQGQVVVDVLRHLAARNGDWISVQPILVTEA